MTPDLFRGLLNDYLAGTISAEDEQLLFEALAQPEYSRQLAEIMDGQLRAGEADRNDFPETFARVHDYVLKHKDDAAVVRMPAKRKSGVWLRYAVAAVFLGVIATTYLLVFHKTDQPVVGTVDVKAPERNKARITLASGRTIYLDSVANGNTIEVDGVRLTKLANGRIVYSGDANTIVYNTASNPRGSMVMDLELNDHSHVWLNAGSSIIYPVAFSGKDRKVSINGEAYFEVAHDARKPFIVEKGNTSVQVLGTHFDVRAYDNDAQLKVTLLQGKVKVNTSTREQLLAPGEQAVVANDAISLNKNANMDDVMAWKNGFTTFHDADLKDILRELEYWYDISTEMPSEVKLVRTVDVPRNVPLKDVLQALLGENGIAYEYDAAKRKLKILL